MTYVGAFPRSDYHRTLSAKTGGAITALTAEHANALLKSCRGHLHADGYAGFGGLYDADPKTGAPAPLKEVACWAHARRKIYDVHVETKSPAAREALEMIARLFAVEADIKGRLPTERVAVPRDHASAILNELRAFLDATLAKISGKSDFANAIRHAPARWMRLTRYIDDGCLELSNNAAERAIRPFARRSATVTLSPHTHILRCSAEIP